MKAKLRLWRGGGTLILAAGLALGSAPVVSAAGAEVDLDVVTKVVTAYQDLLDSHWTDSNCSLSSCVNASSSVFASSGDKKSQRGSSFGGSSKKGRDERKDSGENPKFTQAESALLQVRDAMKDFGLPIKMVKSTFDVRDAKIEADGKMTATVMIGTTKTYEGNDEPSYMLDKHTLTLAPNMENGFAVIEDVVSVAPTEEMGHAVPEVKLESTPLDQLLGTAQQNHPIANSNTTADGNFALLPSHKENLGGSATMQKVNKGTKQPDPDVQKMVAYAKLWTSPEKNPPEYKPDGTPNPDYAGADGIMNPAYPQLKVNCTNFASQALAAGGWKIVPSQTPMPVALATDNDVWTPNAVGKKGLIPSHTWAAARNFYAYVTNKGNYHPLPLIDGIAQPGDLILVDWDPNGKADGELDHTMIVTGTASLEFAKGNNKHAKFAKTMTPRISQKTVNRHNIPLYESMQYAVENGVDLKASNFYAITTRTQ